MFQINIRLNKCVINLFYKSYHDCYKNQEMCIKAVDNYPHALEFVPECYKTQKNV